MEIRFEHSPKEVSGMTTAELRDAFMTDPLMQEDSIQLLYTHYDRVIMGGAQPVKQRLSLETHSELKADFTILGDLTADRTSMEMGCSTARG